MRHCRRIENPFSELNQNPVPSTEMQTMKSSTKAAFVIAIAGVGFLLLMLGGGIVTGTIVNGGMMGSESIGEFSGMWLPILLVVVCSVFLFWVIPGTD
jgi:hypothetical protein